MGKKNEKKGNNEKKSNSEKKEESRKTKSKNKGTGKADGTGTSIDSETDGEEMTVALDLEDGSHVTCAIVTILECQGKDYIVLLPLDENGENHDGEVWFYRYYEDEKDTNSEPILEYIEDDDEYEAVADAFDEYLDNAEFDEYIEE